MRNSSIRRVVVCIITSLSKTLLMQVLSAAVARGDRPSPGHHGFTGS